MPVPGLAHEEEEEVFVEGLIWILLVRKLQDSDEYVNDSFAKNLLHVMSITNSISSDKSTCPDTKIGVNS